MAAATKQILGGTAHKMTADFAKAIFSNKKVLALWQSITPLARNEWICWATSGKLAETRDIRIKKALSKMNGGMRRPCCWAGCMHRTDKALSPSQKWVMGRQSKK